MYVSWLLTVELCYYKLNVKGLLVMDECVSDDYYNECVSDYYYYYGENGYSFLIFSSVTRAVGGLCE